MTELETKVLNTIFEINEEWEQANFEMISEDSGIEISALRGVVTSLVKKGIAKVRDTGCAHLVIVGEHEWPMDHYSDEEWENLKAQLLNS